MKNLFIYFLTLITYIVNAQQPDFQYTLLVEDARGNKDSVVLGYDNASTQYTPSSTFGEIDIKSRPFDSIFEVRATKASNRFSITFHSKKVIANSETRCTAISGGSSIITLLIRAKYYPIKFKWNKTPFQQPCQSNSLLLSSESYFTYDPSLRNLADSLYRTVYLRQQSEKVEAFDKRAPSGQPNSAFYYAFNAPLNNGVSDTIWTYSTVFRIGQGVATSEQKAQELNGFPNPCFEELTLELPDYETGQIEVFDIMGRKVKAIKVESINQLKMDVKDLNHGLYFLKFKTNKEKVYVSKFIKS
jgi:hypothetical protein